MTTIAVLNESDIKNGEMKEVDFKDGGKVLVSRIRNKIHATSAFCTHYGAPLAKGVLSSNGRVVCPWHGACFNVCSGDIEDSPGIDAIHSFKAEIKDGQIFVTADPRATMKENKSRPPTVKGSISGSTTRNLVVVGGGAGALNVVESARESGYSGKITILSYENYAPIDRTKLSKALIGDPTKVQWRTPEVFRNQFGVEIKTGVEVTSCDFQNKNVSTSSGETYNYDTLVLSTGAIPRRLPIDGANLSNVYTLRHVEDAKKIDAAIQEGKRLVVIGSSFISMEIVVAVSKRKLASIDVIGMEEVPFETVLGKEVGKGLQTYHEKQGVKFHMKTKVSKIVASGNGDVATGVEIPGKIIDADVVIMGVGVAPATKFLKDSGINIEKDGGIVVDEYLRVKGVDNVFAIGDIARYPSHISGEPVRIEHWNVASNHGRAVGQTIAGKKQPFEKIPIFWSAQGGQLRYCGYATGSDEVIVQGNPAELKFIAYYIKSGKIVAVATMSNDPLVSKCSELMRFGIMPSAKEIKDGKNPLDIPLPN